MVNRASRFVKSIFIIFYHILKYLEYTKLYRYENDFPFNNIIRLDSIDMTCASTIVFEFLHLLLIPFVHSQLARIFLLSNVRALRILFQILFLLSLYVVIPFFPGYKRRKKIGVEFIDSIVYYSGRY